MIFQKSMHKETAHYRTVSSKTGHKTQR